MADVLLVATILAFFALAAALVSVLDRMVAGSADDTKDTRDHDDEAPEPAPTLTGGRSR